MARDTISDLSTFLAVARAKSFTKAAATLGLSPSAISHTIRLLEERLGVRLLTRTTRSVSLTDAGERLLQTIRPQFEEIEEALNALTALRHKPTGTVRISAGEYAADVILWPVAAKVMAEYSDIKIEIVVDNGLTDIVAERLDAGIRLGEQVDKDMIAVRIGPEMRMAVVGSAAYFRNYPKPVVPQDLTDHRCVNLRLPSYGGFYAWEFEKDGREMRVRVDGALALNSSRIGVKAAVAGHGLAFVLEDLVRQQILDGHLVRVLSDWCPPFPGFYLYYPSRRQLSPAFSVVMNALRANNEIQPPLPM